MSNATVIPAAAAAELRRREATTTTEAPALFNQVRDFITTYAILPGEHYADILALYVLHTWAFDASRTTPYIYITSQGPGSGKTRVIELLQEVCKGALKFDGMTGATAFRLIEARRPTMLLDEVDTIYSGAKNEDLRGVLNSGYKHNGSIPRVDPKSEDGFKDYSTFCPKVLGGIDNGAVPNTVMDRAITILMEKRDGEVAPFYSEDVEDLAADLHEELHAWASANRDALKDRANRPEPIAGVSDRKNDIARPLLTIARVMGMEDRARRAFIAAFTAQDTPLTPEQDALLKVRNEVRNTDATRITSARVSEITGRTGKQIGIWFGQFGIPAPRVIKIDGKQSRGWEVQDFTDAFTRYLPAEQTA